MTPPKQKKGFLHDYGLSVALAGMFLASWAGQAVFQWIEYVNEEQVHNQVATLSGYLPVFLRATFENWQSEFMQVLTFVTMTAVLYHKGSHESKDNDEEMDAALVRIEKRLEELGGQLKGAQATREQQEFHDLAQKVERTRRKNLVA